MKILQVAAYASCGGQVVVVIGVTIGALARWHSMPASQQEPCGRVVKFSVEPVIARMAGVACCRELCGNVIRIRRSLEILEVARSAIRRHRLKLAVGTTLMAGIAIYRCVRSGQREAVVVLLDLLNRDLPTANRMASFAIGAQLPLVDICVAILTALADIIEHHLYVAASAGH